MEPISFIASSAAEAVEQIRARLGPEAVVLNVRPLPAQGLNRLWQGPKIEVLAYVPETILPPPQPTAAPDPFSQAVAGFRQQLEEMRQQAAPIAPQAQPTQVQTEPTP